MASNLEPVVWPAWPDSPVCMSRLTPPPPFSLSVPDPPWVVRCAGMVVGLKVVCVASQDGAFVNK